VLGMFMCWAQCNKVDRNVSIFYIAVADSSDSGAVQVQPTKYEWNTENEDIQEVLIDDEDITENIGM